MDRVVISTGSVADLSSWACRALLPLPGKQAGICYQGPNLPHLFLALNLHSRQPKMEKEGKGQSQLGLSLFIRKTKAFLECHPSAQFRSSVVSDYLRPHRLLHTRLPCPSPTPTACSNSCPSSRCCHPTISSSVTPFSSCLQSFPALGYLPMNQFFASGGQSIGVSASASVLPMNIQD